MNLDEGLSPETIAITAGRPAVGPDSPLNHPISLNSTFVAGGAVGYGRVTEMKLGWRWKKRLAR